MEKKSLSQQTAERLYTMIVVERRFGPGDKLPNELEWSAELRVSPCGKPSVTARRCV